MRLKAVGTPPPSTLPPLRTLRPALLTCCTIQDIHDKLMHSFHNRQICPLKGFIVSAHRLSRPTRHPPRPLLFNPGRYALRKLRPPVTVYTNNRIHFYLID